jgi:Transposase zinc-binding domain
MPTRHVRDATESDPPTPLLTLEENCIPPQAESSEFDGFGPDQRHQDYDLTATETQRFDEPTDEERHATFPPGPILLETRGLTSHAAKPQDPGYRTQKQREFWANQTIFKQTVAAKLREAGAPHLASELEDCHSTYTVAQCGDCGRVEKFPNRCDQFFCPECQPRLSSERRKAVEWWTKLIQQPKHVVLTVRNFPELTKGHVQEFKTWFGRLRRRKFARNWKGGFYAIELTNEGRGWHLHLHALIDAKWIDKQELSRQWGLATNTLGYIVEVKDARGGGYLAEVTKYAVKGVEEAKWSGKDILTFINAFTGVRSFGVFGDLYGARTEFAEWIATLKDAKPKCPCGSCNITYYSESQWLAADFKLVPVDSARPPTTAPEHPEFFGSFFQQQANREAMAR